MSTWIAGIVRFCYLWRMVHLRRIKLPGSFTFHGGCALIFLIISNAKSRYVEMGGMA